MITLITHADEFSELTDSIDWHSAYIREMHSATAGYDGPSFVRILVVLPCESFALEIISFDTESFGLSLRQPLDETNKSATIQRRQADADFGAFALSSGCIGYRKLEELEWQQLSYGREPLFDINGSPADPYNVDWKYILDKSRRT